MTAQSVGGSKPGAIQPVAWLLIVAAIAGAAITVFVHGPINRTPLLEPIVIANVIGSAAGFALAAGLVIGADRLR